jgi:hypothetical protein
MSTRKAAVVALAWALSLLGVGLWAQDGRGQAPPEIAPMVLNGQAYGPVITGPDIGFQRLAGTPERNGKITGRFVVKVNGQWVETASPVGIVR